MQDLSNQPMNDEPNDRQSLEQTDRGALVPQESMDYRTELYARLRNIIDNATESIRTLKDENASLATQKAAMEDQIGVLEQRIRAVTSDLADDERELRKSVEALAQELQGTPTAPAPVSAPSPPPPMPDTEPMSEAEPMPDAEPVPDAEPEPASEAPPVMEEATPSAMEETGPIPQLESSEPPAEHDEHNERDEDERVVAPRIAPRTDGTYTVVAYPFVRFSDLGQFQAALQKLTGVHDVQVRRFAQGTLEMRIGYSGGTDLATTLRTMAAEVEDVQEEEPYQLRVRLRTSQD